jgi:hypothetical protein
MRWVIWGCADQLGIPAEKREAAKAALTRAAFGEAGAQMSTEKLLSWWEQRAV